MILVGVIWLMATNKPAAKRPASSRALPKKIAPKTAAPKKAGRKKSALKRARIARKPAAAKAAASFFLQGDFEQQIRQIYNMSKEEAAATVRKSGVLTPSGKLSATYK